MPSMARALEALAASLVWWACCQACTATAQDMRRSLARGPSISALAALRRLGQLAQGAAWPPRRSLLRRDDEWRYRSAKRRRRQGDCWSLHEQHLFQKPVPMSAELEQAVREYTLMHQRCTNVTDWAAHGALLARGAEQESGPLQGCKYIIYIPPTGHGIGNRIMALVSTFALGLLTNRVLLLRSDVALAVFLCNPFKLSSWTLDPPTWKAFLDPLWPGSRQSTTMGQDPDMWAKWQPRGLMHIVMFYDTAEATGSFFCPENQEGLSAVPVFSVASDQYFVPALYFVPEFDRRLRQLVPDGRVFLHLGRFLLHPNNGIWLRITRFYSSYLAHHSRIVGVQVRKFWPSDDAVDPRIQECLQNISHVLPLTASAKDAAENQDPRAAGREAEHHSIGVVVSSLNRTHADILSDTFNSKPAEGGQLVAVYSLSHEGQEKPGMRQHEQALSEMIILSMCDNLLITEYSTFGFVAAGLAGNLPYDMNIVVTRAGDWRTNGRPACQQVSSEPCFLMFPSKQKRLKCKGSTKNLTAIVPEVGQCHAMNWGLAHKLIEPT